MDPIVSRIGGESVCRVEAHYKNQLVWGRVVYFLPSCPPCPCRGDHHPRTCYSRRPCWTDILDPAACKRQQGAMRVSVGLVIWIEQGYTSDFSLRRPRKMIERVCT